MVCLASAAGEVAIFGLLGRLQKSGQRCTREEHAGAIHTILAAEKGNGMKLVGWLVGWLVGPMIDSLIRNRNFA